MFSKKLYLDGFDWIAALLNYQSRLTPGQGNHFMLVLESAEFFTENGIRTMLKQLDPLLPMLNGSIRRHLLHLAPYWKPGKPEPIPFTTEELLFKSDFPLSLEKFGNSPLPRNQALAVHLITHKKEGSALIFKFSHLLFDGRGAELLLEALRNRTEDLFGENPPGLPSPKLDEWDRQFSCGKQVQRRLIAIHREGKTISHGAAAASAAAFRIIPLSETETETLRARSDREAGPFMLTPYLLALTSAAYREQLAKNEPGNILIPMSIDMRGQDEIPSDAIFFNQWSILPIQIPAETPEEPEKRIAEIRKQIFVSTGERIALAYRAASRLTRIAPPPILLRIVKKMGNSACGTFMFSFLSGTSLEQKTLAGETISNLTHLPSMPPMTGLGVFYNMFNDHLNAVISYRAGVFSEAALERFTTELERKLKAKS